VVKISFAACADELLKLAEKSSAKDVALGSAAALGGAGLVASPGTRGRLLGYQRLYHGTSPEGAAGILESGLDPSFSGSTTSEAWVRMSPRDKQLAAALVGTGPDEFGKGLIDSTKGRVFVTPNYLVAQGYANKEPGAGFIGRGGRVLKADIPISEMSKFVTDASQGGGLMTSEKIPASLFHGGAGFNRSRVIAERLKGLPKYIGEHPGRFSTGLGLAGLGTLAMLYGGRKVIRALKEKK
jgi:hypothetical protein